MNNRIYKLAAILIFFTSLIMAQAKSFQEQQDSTSKVNSSNSIDGTTAVNDEINIKNETGNAIITITDEGSNKGSITLPIMLVPPSSSTDNKLYNVNGTLNFNGSALGAGGATEIDDLSDAKYDGNSLFLGEGAGANNTGLINTAIGTNALNSNTSGQRNTANGHYALSSNTTGDDNTANGNGSLSSNTTGNNNTANGSGSLSSNTTGGLNSAFGVTSLNANTSGFRNTANGSDALKANTTGNSNTANGNFALQANTTGNYNVGIGSYSNFLNREGINNTIIGYNAGRGNTIHNKSGNIFLGYQAGYYETGDNKLYIENSDNSAPLIWGDFATDEVQINGNFHVTGNISSDGATPGVSEINDLTDPKTVVRSVYLGNGSGNSDNGSDNQNTAIGANALTNNTSGIQNVAIGESTLLENLTGQRNTIIGQSAARLNTTGSFNTVLGEDALYNNSTGSGNVALGRRAGHAETGDNKLYINNDDSALPLIWGDFTDGSEEVKINGDFHVTGNISSDGTGLGVSEINDLSDAIYDGFSLFLGIGAGANDDGLQYNTGIGIQALNSNSDGEFNTAIGLQALLSNTIGSSNTSIGYQALNSNTIGNFNVGLGTSSNYHNQEGSFNTLIGYEAGRGISLHNKSGNVFIGYQSGYKETANNKLYIENSDSEEPLIWGDFTDGSEEVIINGDLGVTGKTKIGDSGVPITEIKLIEGTTAVQFTLISYPVGYTQANTFLISCKAGPLSGSGTIWKNLGDLSVSFTETDILLDRSSSGSSTVGYKIVIMKIE